MSDSDQFSSSDSDDFDAEKVKSRHFVRHLSKKLTERINKLVEQPVTPDSVISEVLSEISSLYETLEEDYRSSLSDSNAERMKCLHFPSSIFHYVF